MTRTRALFLFACFSFSLYAFFSLHLAARRLRQYLRAVLRAYRRRCASARHPSTLHAFATEAFRRSGIAVNRQRWRPGCARHWRAATGGHGAANGGGALRVFFCAAHIISLHFALACYGWDGLAHAHLCCRTRHSASHRGGIGASGNVRPVRQRARGAWVCA